MSRTHAICLALSAALSGCGGSSQPDEPPLTIERGCGDVQQAACAAFARCSPESFASRYTDQASCVSVRTQDCIERRAAPGSTVTVQQLEACAQASTKSSCAQVLSDNFFGSTAVPVPECAWQGTLPEGEACIDASQCSSGTCVFYEHDTCGSCVTRSDDSCVAHSECLVGSYCINGQCSPAGKQGDACADLTPCSPELTCLAGQCQPAKQAGEGCGTPELGDCAADLFCNRQSLLCEHSQLLPDATECGVTVSGGNLLCPSGTHCVPDGANRASHCVPAGAQGEQCSFSTDCGLGLRCFEGTCTPVRAEACTAPATIANATYPARLPAVPACGPPASLILTAPKLQLVTFVGDARAPKLEAFAQALGTSAFWHSTTSEYGVAELSSLPPIRLRETPAATLSDAAVQAWLADKLENEARFAPNNGQTVYLIAYPADVMLNIPGAGSSTGQSCLDFGGYHSSVLARDGMRTPYAVIPACVFVEPTTAIAHEVVEAASDPFANLAARLLDTRGYGVIDQPHFPWSLPSGGGAELADLCEWQPLATYQDAELGAQVQRSWSNAAMAGFHQPCVPARASTAYFNAVPTLNDTVSVTGPLGPVRTKGVTIPLGQSKTIPVELLSDAPMAGPWRVSAYDLKEWGPQVDPSNQNEPTLRFDFDTQAGVNGDTLQMTITALKQDPDYKSEPFVLVSRRARDTNVWVGVVGQ